MASSRATDTLKAMQGVFLYWGPFSLLTKCYKGVTMLQRSYNVTKELQCYKVVTMLQRSYNVTKELQFYKEVTMLQRSYNVTKELQCYKGVTILQRSYNVTKKLQCYKGVTMCNYSEFCLHSARNGLHTTPLTKNYL